MSKYVAQYESGSKGKVNIEDMNDVHLINAYKKLLRTSEQGGVCDSNHELIHAMKLEIEERGLDLNYVKPPKPPVEAYEGEADPDGR